MKSVLISLPLFAAAAPFLGPVITRDETTGERFCCCVRLLTGCVSPLRRQHDAGVLSVGIDPNWKHIVPPGQRRVVSEAHCVSDCTQHALPPRGINVFAVNQHTHLLGMNPSIDTYKLSTNFV